MFRMLLKILLEGKQFNLSAVNFNSYCNRQMYAEHKLMEATNNSLAAIIVMTVI